MGRIIPDLGEKLRIARESCNPWIEGFSDEIKERLKYVDLYERGILVPDFETLTLLVNIYNISYESLTGTDKQKVVVVNGLDSMQISIINLIIEMFRLNNKTIDNILQNSN